MNKILLGLDGSHNSFKALEEAISLARLYNAELHTISIEELPRFPETIDEIAEEKEVEDSKFEPIIQKARYIAATKKCEIKMHILVGQEVRTMVGFIKKYRFDLLVLGFMGHSSLYDRVMGSTCQSVVRIAPCSVLVVK